MTSGPQVDRVNHHLPSIDQKRIKSKRQTLTSHVRWSIGFEVPLTDSLAHHSLDYVHFCVRCARFMRKFAPTKTFKTPSKSFKTTTKTIKRLQIPKTRSLCFLMFSAICKKMEILSLLLLFCRVLTELCFLEEAWS